MTMSGSAPQSPTTRRRSRRATVTRASTSTSPVLDPLGSSFGRMAGHSAVLAGMTATNATTTSNSTPIKGHGGGISASPFGSSPLPPYHQQHMGAVRYESKPLGLLQSMAMLPVP